MSEIIMQKITLEDVSLLSEIAKKTFYDTFTGTCTEYDMQLFLDQYYNEIILAAELKNPAFEYYFAVENEKVIGYVLFSESNVEFDEINGSNALELKRFYISKEYHGKGAAHKMMDFLIDHAKAQGYDTLFLGVWEFNYRAQNFYKKFDFKLTSHRHDFPIGNTAQTDVYMWKSLN